MTWRTGLQLALLTGAGLALNLAFLRPQHQWLALVSGGMFFAALKAGG